MTTELDQAQRQQEHIFGMLNKALERDYGDAGYEDLIGLCNGLIKSTGGPLTRMFQLAGISPDEALEATNQVLLDLTTQLKDSILVQIKPLVRAAISRAENNGPIAPQMALCACGRRPETFGGLGDDYGCWCPVCEIRVDGFTSAESALVAWEAEYGTKL